MTNRTRCPKCGAVPCYVYRTHILRNTGMRVRFHRCRACGEEFKVTLVRHVEAPARRATG